MNQAEKEQYLRDYAILKAKLPEPLEKEKV